LAVLPCFKAFQPSAEVGKLGRSNEDCGKLLHNNASKVKVLFLFKDFGECLVNAFCAEVETQLSDYETSARIKQSSVSAEKIQQIDHKRFKITIV
jgi:hypothetical protein